MSTKERAEYLINLFILDFTVDFELVRQAAIKCCRELEKHDELHKNYWSQVEKEIYEFRRTS